MLSPCLSFVMLQVKISIVRRRGKTKSFKTIINNYVLLDKIGEGAFGKVYLTRSMSDGKLYAIKHVDRALLRKKRFSAKSDKVTRSSVVVSVC